MKKVVVMALVCTVFAGSATDAKKPPIQPDQPKFNRSEMLVINLNRGPKSARFYLDQTLRMTKESSKGIDKALKQIEQADREYAKSKGRPDDRYLQSPADRLRQAQATAQQLQQQLEATQEDLRSSVQQSLIR